MTCIELIVSNQDLISEPTYIRFPKEEHIRWLNRGLEDIAVKTGYMTWKWRVLTEGAKSDYPYPDTCKSIYRIEYDGKPLGATDKTVLDNALEAWQAETGAPTDWYPSWNRAYGIYPTPNEVYSIYLYGFDRGATLADDDNTPLIPDQFHMAPAFFAARQMARADKEFTLAASLNKDYMLLIGDMINERNKIEKHARGRSLGTSRATVEEG